MLNNYRIGYRIECTDKYIGVAESFIDVQANSVLNSLDKFEELLPNIFNSCEIVYILKRNVGRLSIEFMQPYGTA